MKEYWVFVLYIKGTSRICWNNKNVNRLSRYPCNAVGRKTQTIVSVYITVKCLIRKHVIGFYCFLRSDSK